MGQSDIRREIGRATVLDCRVLLRTGKRVRLALGLDYPAVRRERDILYDLGDARVQALVRVMGDTLDSYGIYLRGDLRIPTGSRVLYPFSFASLDGGPGAEGLYRTPMFGLRGALTYTLVGERRKVGPRLNRNFLILALSIDSQLREGTSFAFTTYSIFFRDGGGRDVYQLSLRQELSEEIEMALDGALDSGSEEERVFNSLFSLSFVYRFRSREQHGVEK